MERLKAAGVDLRNPVFDSRASKNPRPQEPPIPKNTVAMTQSGVTRLITWSEIKAQDPSKPWFVVNGNVYDGTPFLKEHPGGPDSILLAASDDASEDFMAIHSPAGQAKLAEFHIGILADPQQSSTREGAIPGVGIDLKQFLHSKIWKSVTLVSRISVSHDTEIFRFRLPDPSLVLGLPPGQHIYARLLGKSGTLVQRAYTPLSDPSCVGHIDILIKLYRPCEEFPNGGLMSSLFDRLAIGQDVQLKGPLGSFTWLGRDEAMWKGNMFKPKSLVMICGGSGITPILQVLRAVLNDQESLVKLVVLTSNKSEKDILCREELDSYLSKHCLRYQVHHLITRGPSVGLAPGRDAGRISEALLRKYMPSVSNDTLILTCGPDGMVETVKRCLTKNGWDITKSLVVF